MFAQNVWEPCASLSRRGLTTLLSFTLQLAGVGMLLVLPLIYPGGPPQLDLMRPTFTPLPPTGPQGSPPARTVARSNRNYTGQILVVPGSIPRTISAVDNPEVSPSIALGIGVPSGTGAPHADNAMINSISNMSQPFVPKPPLPVTHPARVSAMMEGYLIHQVEPVYPPLARAARVQGTVELHALITTQGTIEKLQVLRGHPLLVKATVDAVDEWRYRPYVLNGEPVEVETDVTVKFSLSGGWQQ